MSFTTLEGLINKVFNFQKNPGIDYTTSVLLTGTLTALPARACLAVTIINSTGTDLIISVNSAIPITILDGTILTFSVTNTELIQVQGTGALGYVITI